MPRAVIVHCWEGFPEYCWYPQAKRELEQLGFEVQVPAMPDTAAPQLKPWLAKLAEVIGTPDTDLFLIGHSVGCITIMRYLETLKVGQRLGGTVFVAGFTYDLGYKEIKNFFTTPIKFAKIKASAAHFVAINSDNDPHVPLTEGDVLKEKLGAKLIVKHAMKHFSGSAGDSGSCTSLPDVSQAIERMGDR